MRKTEHDFFTWISFPSSAKLINDVIEDLWWPYQPVVPVSPEKRLKYSFMTKQKDVSIHSGTTGEGFNSATQKWEYLPLGIMVPSGTNEWTLFQKEITVPASITAIRIGLGMSGPGVTWYDDLKIYQDDVLIYSNDFSNWDPVIGAGVGAPIGGVAGYLLKEPLGPMVSEVVGAVVGGALGGGVGLLTAMGLVPQIPIPSLGAAPEGPGAPARLGKYQITG